MIPDIIIPTCKSADDCAFLYGLLYYSNRDNNIVFTHLSASAAVNRNAGLNAATTDIVIMVDDDIRGFYPGWDQDLIKPLLLFSDIIYVSARLLNSDGTVQNAMGARKEVHCPLIDVPTAPSACVAFRKSDIRFDKNYVGSGWEDTDFVRQLKQRTSHGRIVINNTVKLIHDNEMKNQLGDNYIKNRDYYNKKWNCNEQ
jgi:glycosyltransferase involved in cell wall biosynthesis